MSIPDKNINYDVTEEDWKDFWYGEEDDESSTDNESEHE